MTEVDFLQPGERAGLLGDEKLGASPCAEVIRACADGTCPCAEVIRACADGACPCAGVIRACADGASKCAEVIRACAGGARPCAEPMRARAGHLRYRQDVRRPCYALLVPLVAVACRPHDEATAYAAEAGALYDAAPASDVALDAPAEPPYEIGRAHVCTPVT